MGVHVKKLSSLLALLVGVMATLPAHAAPASTSTPNTVNAAFGAYDFDKDGGRQSVDYRLEYEWGLSLIPMINHDWANLDQWVLLHPIVGFEGNGDFMTYFNGGLGLDVPLGRKFVFSLDEALGLYGHGDSKQSLDSAFEMRSQLELGYNFDNSMRLSGYISHMSNVDTGDKNPGAEVAGAYLRVPVSWLAH
jgi:hypothetical protein